MRILARFFTLGVAACVSLAAPPLPAQRAATPVRSSDYLYLWTASADSSGPDFLAVYDIRDDAKRPSYGALVATVPVPGRSNGPHHTEHEMPVNGLLFANGFRSGQSFVFDLTTPTKPTLAKHFGDMAGLMHPHSFWRLPNGNVLSTFQMQHDSLGMAPGGLVEMTPRAAVVRSTSANRAPGSRADRPYSAAIVAAIDRVVVTTTDMDKADSTRNVQLWRLSDLSLQHTIVLPDGPHFAAVVVRRQDGARVHVQLRAVPAERARDERTECADGRLVSTEARNLVRGAGGGGQLLSDYRAGVECRRESRRIRPLASARSVARDTGCGRRAALDRHRAQS